MNKKELMFKFLKSISNKKYMTIFLKNIFDYDKITDLNYISRITSNNNEIILDIYDNISNNRFNRYIFNFTNNLEYQVIENNNIFIHYISILNNKNLNNKLLKFASLFNYNDDLLIIEANKILDKSLVAILKKINHK